MTKEVLERYYAGLLIDPPQWEFDFRGFSDEDRLALMLDTERARQLLNDPCITIDDVMEITIRARADGEDV